MSHDGLKGSRVCIPALHQGMETINDISEVTISATKAMQYMNPVSNLANRTSVKLLETPQFIQSVPQQVIQDLLSLIISSIY